IRLAMLEKEEELVALKYTEGEVDKKYQIGVLAITFPILYAIIDGIGTFLDGVYLDELKIIPEDRALLAYEFTFFLIAIIVYIYVKFIKKETFYIFKERDRGAAAILETTGQFFYVFAMAGNAMIAAPIIAAHGIFSVLLSRVFLREILTKKQYIIIGLVMLGIILLGISDEM
ncbi:MAG TPA: EamA family transporter, partial [Pseudogracilibacillus sp.]|nr:EamA family transporter [Pseudogracilibacillus sp.]